MRIGVDVRELAQGTSTGIGRYLKAFLRFAREALREHSFVLYGDGATDWRGLEWAPGRRLSRPWPLSDHVELSRLLREDGAEAFFSPYYKAPWRCPCPAVVTIHDAMFLEYESSPRRELMAAAARAFAERSAAVITVSEYSRTVIARELRVEPRKLVVVPNAVPEGFAPASPAAREEALRACGLREGAVLYVGGFKPSKNVGALVEAHAGLPAALRERHPLVLVGPPAALPGARVLSGVPDARLAALYSACALCVVPSLSEGFGMPALEAMACGAAVLASNRASLPEVVGGAGALAEPDAPSLRAAMERLLSDTAILDELRRKGLARAAGYSYRTSGARILDVLRRCLSS